VGVNLIRGNKYKYFDLVRGLQIFYLIVKSFINNKSISNAAEGRGYNLITSPPQGEP